MGLDVTAYQGLIKLDCVFDADGEPIDPITREPIDDCFLALANRDFPGRAEGLEHKGVYTYLDCMSGPSLGYGEYNGWREQLAKLAGYQPVAVKVMGRTELLHSVACWDDRPGPFTELINFTDCDGVIGPVVSARLFADFVQFDEKAKSVGGDFYETYREFFDCFRMAAQGGAVHFH